MAFHRRAAFNEMKHSMKEQELHARAGNALAHGNLVRAVKLEAKAAKEGFKADRAHDRAVGGFHHHHHPQHHHHGPHFPHHHHRDGPHFPHHHHHYPVPGPYFPPQPATVNYPTGTIPPPAAGYPSAGYPPQPSVYPPAPGAYPPQPAPGYPPSTGYPPQPYPPPSYGAATAPSAGWR